MAYFYGAQHQQHQQQHHHHHHHHHQTAHSAHPQPSHPHHGGRSRRAPRLSSQNSHRQFRGVRSMKDLGDPPAVSVFRARFEACKGFELDDDLEFCPGLLTEDELQSVHSSSSDRSSLSSGSPSSSPLQQNVQPVHQVSPPFSLAQTFQPSTYTHHNQAHSTQPSMKIHQPSALRSRNPIPIVNPNTGMRVASPPVSVSPARLQQHNYSRRW